MDKRDGKLHIGVDAGGTFTDIIFFDAEGRLHASKVPSNRSEPGKSTIDGLRALLGKHRISGPLVTNLCHTHGSTIAINTLIERLGSRVGLLTTRGFKDVLELGRLALPHPMDFKSRRASPLIPRARVKEISGRLGADGHELEPLSEHSVIAAVDELMDCGVKIIVVCLLHSYRNAAHELQVRDIIEKRYPALECELSSAVWPQAREYERAILATINAYVREAVVRYLDYVSSGARQLGIQSEAGIIRSNGGMQRASTIRENPVTALLSGPAAGVSASAYIAGSLGIEAADLITVDVGGTSIDVGVVRNGMPVLSADEHIADFPVLTPGIAVSSVGGGAGSIIWLDEANNLMVGPRSVGADPGPACYGWGSNTPCLTDAFLVSGWLSEDQPIGGTIHLHLQEACKALQPISDKLGCSVVEVADAAIALAIAAMGSETSSVLSRRGIDAPKFTMVAFGGAGPLIGALLAEMVYVDKVLIPAAPGVLSALGAVHADVEVDFIRPIYGELGNIEKGRLSEVHRQLMKEAAECLIKEEESIQIDEKAYIFSAEMRYQGQGYDIETYLDANWLEDENIEAISSAFHGAYQRQYGYSNTANRIWIREIRLHAIGRVPKPYWRKLKAGSGLMPTQTREIRVNGKKYAAKLYDRALLCTGDRVTGPAIIHQVDTTTLIPAGWRATQTEIDVLIMEQDGS